MPRAAKLKVYRTAIGFHDAYVAAPSQTAALKTWGADVNLFARGAAELVTEEALAAEPLAHPGVFVKRLHGTTAEHLAALPKDDAKRANKPTSGKTEWEPQQRARAKPKKPAPPPRPRPDRSELDACERVLDDRRGELEKELSDLHRQEAELQQRRRAMEERGQAELEKLEQASADAHARFAAAMADWRG